MKDRELRNECPLCEEPGKNIVSSGELYFICTNCGLVDPYDLIVKKEI